MAFTVGGNDLGFEGISEGISKQGMEAYLEQLKLDLLNSVSEKLDDTQDMQNAINAGWQGASRDKFYRKFDTAIEATKEDLAAEYADLVNKLSELAQDFYAQDANMIDD